MELNQNNLLINSKLNFAYLMERFQIFLNRPKPTVLLQHSNKSTFKMDEVLAAEGIWAVFYDGKPINLKSSSLVANYPGPKYKKVSFSNPGHAENLAKKLNAQHNTDKFGVYLLKSGEKFSR